MTDAKLIKIDRNGSKHYEGMIECDRCQGRGWYAIGVCNGELVPSHVDNAVCYKCHGAGKVRGKWIERTPEYQAKLDAKRAEKEAKRQAELEAQRKAWEAEEARREAEKAEKEAKIKAQKAISQYVGEVGQKIEITATYEYTASWEQRAYMSYGTETKHCHGFRDDQGNAFVWFTTKGIYDLEKGDKAHIKAIVKTHSVYKDEKQTGLKNCKITKEGA